jgi:tight adherence protein B
MLFFLFLLTMAMIAASIILLTTVFAPSVEDKVKSWQQKKEESVEKKLDSMFEYKRSPQYIVSFYFILPPLFGILGFLFSRSPLLAFVGAVAGLFIPTFVLKLKNSRRRQKFNNQIIDAIMILSSSLKGGLSLLQSLEVLMEEMPVPMSQEIGLVVKENKIGVTLEESLRHLDKRMNMEELSMIINSILVARETGGDLTKVFSRLITSIRDNRKLKESIQTLTLQGKLQGIIMSILPIVFVWWVWISNRHHFDIMLENDLGRMLLIIAVVLQVIGMVLIRKFSAIKV